MTNARPRDSQRSKVYTAEQVLMPFENGDPALQTLSALQQFVDNLTQEPWFQRRWGQRKIQVKLGRSGGHAEVFSQTITLGRYGRQPAFILHEVAHCLTPWNKAWHGPEYVGVYLTLVLNFLGKDDYYKLSDSFRKHRVRRTLSAVPDPSRPVISRAAQAAKKREVANQPPTQDELTKAADVIRRAVRNGRFGPSGRKSRDHALEVARRLS